MKRLLWLPLLLISCQPAYCVEWLNHDAFKRAIFIAEGGNKAKKPYGVLSVPCVEKSDCGRIVDNSIRNNLKRWARQGGKADADAFIAFFGARWCPLSDTRDKTGLNRHWVGNVQRLYAKYSN